MQVAAGQQGTVGKPGLADSLVRIERARKHLAEFDAQVRPIAAACRDAIVHEHDEQQAELIFRLGSVPAVPPMLSAVLGDAIHSLRISLDYLAWQLVLAAGGTPGKETSFPIFTTPKTAGIKPGVTASMQKLLDELQPSKRAKPEHHDLEALRKLDNRDKHHALLITIVGVKNNIMAWWGDAEPTGFNPGPYNSDPEICRFSYRGGGDIPGGFRPSIDFTVRMEEPEAGPWGKLLSASDLVRRPLAYIEDEVIPRFRQFF